MGVDSRHKEGLLVFPKNSEQDPGLTEPSKTFPGVKGPERKPFTDHYVV